MLRTSLDMTIMVFQGIIKDLELLLLAEQKLRILITVSLVKMDQIIIVMMVGGCSIHYHYFPLPIMRTLGWHHEKDPFSMHSF